MLQAGRSPVQVSDEVDFFNLPNHSSRTIEPFLTLHSLSSLEPSFPTQLSS
jgi:hypothetical protein